MILVLLWGKDALSRKVKKDNCWSEQSPEKLTVSTVPFLGGHPVYKHKLHQGNLPFDFYMIVSVMHDDKDIFIAMNDKIRMEWFVRQKQKHLSVLLTSDTK